jgi:hypothetical protein
MRMLTEMLDALLDGLTPAAAVSPHRRRRHAKGRRGGRWDCPGPERFHLHYLTRKGRRRFRFIQRAGHWVCPYCCSAL